MKTAAYAIAFNEINRVDRWIENTEIYDYRVVLDTGSTDGTYEALQKVPGIILAQKRMEPFRFDQHRNLSLSMVPGDVDWCVALDIDEWFSANMLEELAKAEASNPNVSALTVPRLDINTVPVYIGPPEEPAMLRIHRPGLYEWRCPVWEHLWYLGDTTYKEVYNGDVYLIHDQDLAKPRTGLYLEIMQRTYGENPRDHWNSWYLLKHYYRNRQIEPYIDVALAFYSHYDHPGDDKYRAVQEDLANIYRFVPDIDESIRQRIGATLSLGSTDKRS